LKPFNHKPQSAEEEVASARSFQAWAVSLPRRALLNPAN
jgi:hypothetical protein